MRRSDKVGYWFVVPAFLFMAMFMVYPVVYNAILSMQHVDVMTLLSKEKEFVLFDNYVKIFKDKMFWNSLKNTFIFTIGSIAFQFGIGFFLAVLFNRESKGFKFMRAVMMVPYIMPATVSAILFKFIFNVSGGIANEALMALGMIKEPIEWLLTGKTAMISVIIGNIWCGIPFNMILLSSGLAGIPTELYESAILDGANIFQKFFYITVPQLRSSIEAILVLGFVYTFRCFEMIYVMTGGGPANGTELMTLLSYRSSFVEFNFSQGAAVANVLFLILFVVGLFYTKMLGREDAS